MPNRNRVTPMECSRVKAILFEYADTEIPEEFRESVDAHLAICRSCAGQLETLKEQASALRAMPRVNAPGDFLEKVRSRLEKPSLVSRLKEWLSALTAPKRVLQMGGAAAVVVLVIATTQVMLRDNERKTTYSPALRPQSAAPLPQAQAPGKPLPDAGKNGAGALMAVPSAEPVPPPPAAGTRVVSLTLKLSGNPAPKEFREDSTGRGGASAPNPTAGMKSAERKKMTASMPGAAARTEGAARGNARPERRKISSDVRTIIERANGKVLSEGPDRGEASSPTLLAEIPSANYRSFLDQLRKLGEVESNGDEEPVASPDTNIRVSIDFDARD